MGYYIIAQMGYYIVAQMDYYIFVQMGYALSLLFLFKFAILSCQFAQMSFAGTSNAVNMIITGETT